MSYVDRRRYRARRRALGDAVSDTLARYLKTTGSVLATAKTILDDPALPQVATLINEMHDLEPKTGPGGTPAPGIGLNKLVTPLRAYVYTRRHKWALPLAVAAVLGVPFLVGYATGRSRR